MGQEIAGNRPSQTINQALGLLIFLGGVVLLALVFLWAYRLYEGIDANLLQVQPAQVQPVVPGLGPSNPLPPGGLTAQPQPRGPLSSLALVLLAKLLILLVLGWIGGLIASKGIGLAVGPPRTVDRASS
jgi:hypothetical protein